MKWQDSVLSREAIEGLPVTIQESILRLPLLARFVLSPDASGKIVLVDDHE
jgi:hypothetical protein